MRKLDSGFQITIESVALSPDGRWLAANQSIDPFKRHKDPIRYWDLRDGNPTPQPLPGENPTRLSFSPDGAHLCYISSAKNGMCLHPFPSGARATRVLKDVAVSSYAFVPGSTKMVTAANYPHGWDLATKKPFPIVMEGLDFTPYASGIAPSMTVLPSSILVRPDGGAVIAQITQQRPGGDEADREYRLQMFGFPDGKKLAQSKPIAPPPGGWSSVAITRLIISPDGRFVAGLRLHDLVVFDAETLAEITTLTPAVTRDPHRANSRSAYCLAFAPDSQRLAAGGRGGKITIWHTGTWKKECDLDCGSDAVYALTFGHNGLLVAGADFNPVLWEPEEYAK
jgi:WD40 repeat protein